MRRFVSFLVMILIIVGFSGTALAQGGKPSGATSAETFIATVLTALVACFFLMICMLLAMRSNSLGGGVSWTSFLLAAVVAVGLHIIVSAVYPGYGSDMACFKSWADTAYNAGLSNFYNATFCDYPPGYIYVLWVAGFLHSLMGPEASPVLFAIIIKLPALIAQIGAGALAYRIASREGGKTFALLASALILFNPALFFDGAAWGQMDAVFTLFIVLCIYYLKKENYLAGAAFFAVALLIKPQAILFLPVVGLAYLYSLFKKGELKKSLIGIFGGLAIIIAVVFIGALPFTPASPKSGYNTENAGDKVYAELDGESYISSIRYYASGTGSFSVSYSWDGQDYEDVMAASENGEAVPLTINVDSNSSDAWHSVDVDGLYAEYIGFIVDSPGVKILEVGFCDADGDTLPVIFTTRADPQDEGENRVAYIFDEQNLVPRKVTNPAFWIVDRYVSTVGSYPYATLNAFNLFSLFTAKEVAWVPDTNKFLFLDFKTWGMIFIALICLIVVFLQWRSRERRPLFELSAFLIISLFMLAHMMHERYIVPSCALLVFAYIYSRDGTTLFFAGAFSLAALFNLMATLYADTTKVSELPALVFSGINMVLYIAYAVITIKRLASKKVVIKSPALNGQAQR